MLRTAQQPLAAAALGAIAWLALAPSAHAQTAAEPAEPEVLPSPTAAPLEQEEAASEQSVFVVIDRNVSDDDVIRWAAQEVGGPRAAAPARTPRPPEPYLAASRSRASVILDPEPALRILAEVGGGALGVLLGGTAGALLVWAVLEAEAIPQVELGAVAGAVVMGALGVSSGVTLGADATGGRGNFGHAFMGQMIGALVALPVVVWGLTDGELAVGVAAAAVLPLIGGVLGYELGHADAGPGPRSAFVVPIRDGALAGLSGSLE